MTKSTAAITDGNPRVSSLSGAGPLQVQTRLKSEAQQAENFLALRGYNGKFFKTSMVYVFTL